MKHAKRIGFVDYKLDNFHANTYLSILRGPLAERGYRVAGATAWDPESSRTWCINNDLPYYENVADLAPHADYFMILAPADAHLHLAMCEQVLPIRKPTFVDKTFAPNLAAALRIFALADEYGTPIQSTSALRSTEIQMQVASQRDAVRSLCVWAGGTNFDEYGVHPLELLISCFGADVIDLMRLGPERHFQLMMRFPGNRLGIIDFNNGNHVEYAAALTTDESTLFLPVGTQQLFENAMSDILDFFDARAPQFDRAETLRIQQIKEIALRPESAGTFLPLSDRLVSGPHFHLSQSSDQLTYSKTIESK